MFIRKRFAIKERMEVLWALVGVENASVYDGIIGSTAIPNCFTCILSMLLRFSIWRRVVEEVLSFCWARKLWKISYMQYHCVFLIGATCTYNITDCRGETFSDGHKYNVGNISIHSMAIVPSHEIV
jgi:hypothetical protein